MNIEKTVLDYLSKELGVPVHLEEKSLDKYVLITKVGSSRENFLDSATFSIKSYDTSKYKASVLNDKVKNAMDNIIKLPTIASSKLNSDYESTDTQSKKYRYTCLYHVHHY